MSSKISWHKGTVRQQHYSTFGVKFC
nr:unnamed protein product [Callosobruchus analis]